MIISGHNKTSIIELYVRILSLLKRMSDISNSVYPACITIIIQVPMFISEIKCCKYSIYTKFNNNLGEVKHESHICNK